MRVVEKDLAPLVYKAIVFVNSLALLFGLTLYGYGGFFSRYLSDDYCESSLLFESRNVWDAAFKGYMIWLNSYSIMIVVQLTEWAGIWGFRLMAGVTILFWVASLMWLFSEIEKTLRLRLSVVIYFVFTALAIFLSLYQSPAMYQVLYWRTGLIPYTLPLAFFASTAAFILWYVRQPYRISRAVWMRLAITVLIFFVSGLCETTSALQVGILFLAVTLTWLTHSKHQHTEALRILIVAFIAAVVSLLIITFSPGTAIRLDAIMTNPPLYNPFKLSVAVIVYTAQFLWDNLKVTPLPILIALLTSFGILYYQFSDQDAKNLPQFSTVQLRLAILILLLCMFIAIGFSFAPSAFVRTYPAARVRFASHFVMNLSLIFVGGILGILASRIQLPIKTAITRGLVVIMLGGLCFYSLYASSKIAALLPEYKNFAAAWDERDASIRESIANGATDLVVVQLDSMGGIGEYKGNARHWINRCAAQFYGLNSIIAIAP